MYCKARPAARVPRVDLRRFSLRRSVDEPHPTQYHEDATDHFYDGNPFGLFVPIEETLHHFCGGAGCDDYRAMADAVGQQQHRAVKEVGGSQLKRDAQHRRHVGKRAGAEGDTEHQSEQESSEQAFAFHPDLPRP